MRPSPVAADSRSTLLLIAFVVATLTGLNPLAERVAIQSAGDTGAGDIVRQMLYLGLFAWACVLVKGRIARNFPLPVAVLFGWFAITLAWSPVPDIAARRLAFTAIVAAIAFIVAGTMPLRQLVVRVHWTIAALLAASLIAAVLAPPLAVHQPGDPESAVVGSIRGIFYHKNLLGAVSALGVLFSLHDLLDRKGNRLPGLAALAVAVLCLVLSYSRTSQGMAAVAVAVYLLWQRFPVARRFFWAGLAAAFTLGILFSRELLDILSDPAAFTGRGTIWSMTGDIFRDHPIGGMGFQSIFQTGRDSAFAHAGAGRFLSTLSHAHNGYLEVAASTGIVGLVLLGWAVLQGTFAQFGRLYLPRGDEAFLAALVFFILLHALLESGLADRDRPTWVMLLLAMGAIHARALENRGAQPG